MWRGAVLRGLLASSSHTHCSQQRPGKLTRWGRRHQRRGGRARRHSGVQPTRRPRTCSCTCSWAGRTGRCCSARRPARSPRQPPLRTQAQRVRPAEGLGGPAGQPPAAASRAPAPHPAPHPPGSPSWRRAWPAALASLVGPERGVWQPI